ncbi:hypothetical protein MYX82_14385, partial [Acidobacteria bacterium AH-259-D05]|nr:hypothetical protein [Acidobacteria bacterium AH-259-D05]
MSNDYPQEETRRQKVLMVKLGSFGDIIHTVPAQQEILQLSSSPEIHWLTEPPYEDLLRRVPGISQVWRADTKKWRRKIFSIHEGVQLIRSLRRQNFDLALDFQGLIKSAILARLSGARRVIGFSPEGSREPASAHFYSETIAGDDGSQPHAIELNLELTRSLGCNPNGAS